MLYLVHIWGYSHVNYPQRKMSIWRSVTTQVVTGTTQSVLRATESNPDLTELLTEDGMRDI